MYIDDLDIKGWKVEWEAGYSTKTKSKRGTAATQIHRKDSRCTTSKRIAHKWAEDLKRIGCKNVTVRECIY